MAYTLPKLSYAYDALEPHIDAATMEIHHTKHHQTYINNVNAALEGTEYADLPVEELVKKLKSLPENLQGPVRNNGGGHANHSLFWTVMAPNAGGNPVGDVAKAIDKDLGGFDKFKDAFTKAALTRFGSGWAWLSVTPDKKVVVESTGNQDSPLMEGNTPHPRPGRVGTRVLPEVPEPPSGIHRRVLQRHRLERSRAPLPGSDRLIGVAG